MEDRALLDEFVKSGSQNAFRELVDRHLLLVYSAARRMVRDPHLAEEVAQSVFTTLARKAESIRPPQVLGGWLYNTARHLAMHALRAERRRREREQIAYAMQSESSSPPEIAEQLEPAMAELHAEDRDALVLRYLANHGLREVGAELGISEEAARKRVIRALERLRTVLEHRSVSTSCVLLATALASSAMAVPSGLAATISTTALLPAATSASLTTATVIAVKAKAFLTTIALIALGIAVAPYFLDRSTADAAPPGAKSVAAVKIPNDTFLAFPGYPEQVAAAGQQFGAALLGLGAILHNDERFTNEISATVRRTTNSQPAGHIQCLLSPTLPGAGDYLASLKTQPLHSSRFTRHDVGTNSPLIGKRVRVSTWLKTKDVQLKAGAFLVIINAEGNIFACDPMTDRPINGTTDWSQIELITDVPAEPCAIYLGATLYGAGEIWLDDFQIAVAPTNTPITDDRIWHVWSPNPNDYSLTKDFKNQHDGHPSLCISYVPEGSAPAGSWMWWGQDIRDPAKYRGHSVRMSVWTKSEDVRSLRPNLRPKGPYFKLLAQDKISGGKAIRGTTDWTLHTITCKIPEGTQCLDTGFAFHGSGKVWIDMESLKYEIVDSETR
ncbi:MAG TPA: sigma-70 family RNA polymerase sigma factor [Candidatus Saccharimonadales bacterium]|nr:sigma-70 family RNA polymerase sigma factor [Candidatus Saccharimonadales bacterium]